MVYPSPAGFKVSVDNVIFSVDSHHHRLLVLLAQRPHLPHPWCLPGTWVRPQETLEAAAYRTLAERIQVQDLYLEQLYTLAHPSAIAVTAGQTLRCLSVSYFALIHYEGSTLLPQTPAPVAWHNIRTIPPLAFDHNPIVEYGYQRLRSKLEYSPIAFEVLPELFTLNDLFQLYATVLGEDFADYSNFRARLLKLGFLKDTGQKISRGAGRPASLFQFDPQAFAPFKDKAFVFV